MLLLAQMGIGEYQWRNRLPWEIVLVHVALGIGGLGESRRARRAARLGVAAKQDARTGTVGRPCCPPPVDSGNREHLRMEDRPNLRRPVFVAAFRGWNDGAQGASLAAGFLARSWQAERFADIDPEEFFDFQAVRPHVSLEEGLTRRIDWPENALYAATDPVGAALARSATRCSSSESSRTRAGAPSPRRS